MNLSLYDFRRDVVGNEVTGRPAPYGGLRYNKVGHIRRNSTGTPSRCHDTRAKPLWNAEPCFRSEQEDVITLGTPSRCH